MTRFNVKPRGFPLDPTIMPAGGRSLTIPNQAIDISIALKRFSAPTIEEKLKGYYEEEGMELPNFDRLDRIERLDLLAASRDNLRAAKERANNAIADYEAKVKADAEAKILGNPIPNSSKSDSNEAGK